jgi:hypothetical protein
MALQAKKQRIDQQGAKKQQEQDQAEEERPPIRLALEQETIGETDRGCDGPQIQQAEQKGPSLVPPTGELPRRPRHAASPGTWDFRG